MKIICLTLCLLSFGLLASCSDWTQMETVDNKVNKPWEQDPVLWAQYTAALRAYKQGEHFVAYVRLYNSPKVAGSEQDFMRCLPDSLDFVSLTNADNFSAFDREDMAVMREKGTKVLYQVDYARRAAELNDAAKLGGYLDKVIAVVQAEGLDGYAFTGIPQIGDAATAATAALIVEKLAADASKTLVFEGNPLFVAEGDRAKIDYFVLDTEKTEDVLNVRLQVLGALGYAKVPAAKLVLAADAGAPLLDEERKEFAAIDEMSRRVISFGPLAGLATYDISKDYYHSDRNYQTIRTAIQTMNPSK
ncbi:MAG: glycoside hydrolase family 18 [Alistipes sp.]